MPTFERSDTFIEDFRALDKAEQQRVFDALLKFRDDLLTMETDPTARMRAGLGVQPFHGGDPGDMEIRWSRHGRAIFRYGAPRQEGKQHVEWLRVGQHITSK